MPKEIRLNAFDMNCVAHQSPGLWLHPDDRAWDYRKLSYWTDLAQLLERGRFDGLFIADVLGIKLGTVRSRIHRGRQALRDDLAAHPEHGIRNDTLHAKIACVAAAIENAVP